MMTLDQAHATLSAIKNARKEFFKAEPHNIDATAKRAMALFNQQDAALMRISGKPLSNKTILARSLDGCREDIRNTWRRAVVEGCYVKVYE